MKDFKVKLDNFSKSLEQIKHTLGFSEKLKRITELEIEAEKPDFWKDKVNAGKTMKEIVELREQVAQVEKVMKLIADAKVADELEMERELSQKIEEIGDAIKNLVLATYLSGQHDSKNAIVSIHAGQGGTEAMDWASMLYRMYLRFCEKRGWTTQMFELSEGEEAGIKKVTVNVGGQFAYGYLKGEAGTHRLVRQSPFNADKLRQTSFALVEVLPELEETDLPGVLIKNEDLEWQFFRASTQGGQNVQKVSTAVRLTHIPSGIVVTSQAERHQVQNRKIALTLLRAKLWLRKQAEEDAQKRQLKGEYRPASWGNQIRSYVLHPYKMVKDLRTDVETSDYESVLNGDLDAFIEAELKKTADIKAH